MQSASENGSIVNRPVECASVGRWIVRLLRLGRGLPAGWWEQPAELEAAPADIQIT